LEKVVFPYYQPSQPMMLYGFVFLLLLALFVSWLIPKTGRRGPGPASGLFFFFLLFLLAGWAASLWIVPVGPAVYEVYWAGPLVVTVLLALVLLAAIPTSRPRREAEEKLRQDQESPTETRARHALEIGFTLFFWIAVLGLILVIVAGHL
jgi:hypothetical protein